MNPIISCSVGNSSVIPGVAYLTRKNNSLTRLNFSRSSLRHGSSTRRFLFPSFVANGVFPQNKRICSYRKNSRTSISATETEVSVEVQDSPVANEVSGESPSNEVGTSEDSSPKSDANTGSTKAKRSRPARKSEMPPVKNEDLVPGAAFTGKVKSIQPFGAFVDFGAFTDGLVHISMLSDSFVKDVSSVVSLGQEVTVKVIEVNAETKRISLSMRENTDTGKRNDASNNAEKSGSGRWDSPKSGPRKDKKNTKFVVGQELQGTVKNMTRSGTFISLPEGEEGFLPLAEEDDDGFGKIMGKSSLEIGREVSVRVLRITRGQATLTMKKEGAVAELDKALAQVGDDVATNPFVLAFRRNKDIAKFLDQREKLQSEVKSSTTETVEDSLVDSSTTVVDAESNQEGSIINGAAEKETEAVAESLASEEELDAVNSIIEEAIQTDIATSNVETDSPVDVADESLIETDSPVEVADQIVAEDEKQSETDNGKEEFVAATEEDNDAVEPGPVVTESEITSSAPAPQETPDDNVAAVSENNEIDASLSPEESLNKDVIEETNQLPSPESPATEEVQEQTPVSAQVEDEAVAIASETNSNLSNSNGQTGITASDEGSSKATISPALVKQLRDETGAGMMDCKNALSESEGDITKAQELLRKKGLASADKKAARATAEGRIGSYIHDSRIGVLVEVNCETDFVSRGEIFKELVDDIAMQVAACPQVEYVVTEDVPEEFVKKETEIEMQKEDLASKPEQIRSRIVEGRIRKRLEDLALLEQPYIKNDKVTVKDMVKQTIATIGENMKVTRFVRFNLGEGLEKKSEDFAAEVAAQTTAKPLTTPVKEEPAAAEAKETEPKCSHYRYETYPKIYPNRVGSMVPFSLRWLHALIPIKLGQRQQGIDRLYNLLDFVREKIKVKEDDNLSASVRVWRKREVFVVNCIIGHHLSHKEFGVCLSLIKTLISRDPEGPFLISQLGYIQLQTGDLEGAKDSFLKAEGKNHGSLSDVEFKNLVNRNKALIYMVGKDYVSAVREYDECIERDHSDIVAFNNKALCLMYLRDLSDSIKVLENALERVPTVALNETLVVNLCSMYELAYVNHSDIKRTLSSWIARVAPDDFDSTCTRT